MSSIEGNPFITRFKTMTFVDRSQFILLSIEGNPFITRFKTTFLVDCIRHYDGIVLKVIHL